MSGGRIGAGQPSRWDKRFRRATWRLRGTPDFLVIGAQKAGTTSLFAALRQHPQIQSCKVKEPQFFAYNYSRGAAWYRAMMPIRRPLHGLRAATMLGEASTYYLNHPLAAERAAKMVPRAKIIAVLREPAARSLSHFLHEVRRRRETRPLREAVEGEAVLLDGEVDRILRGEERRHAPHETASYVDRSDYGPQLERWFSRFARDQVLVIRFEDLVGASSSQVLATVFDFLGVAPLEIAIPHANAGDSDHDAADIEWLWTRTEHCRAGVESLLGVTWERPGAVAPDPAT